MSETKNSKLPESITNCMNGTLALLAQSMPTVALEIFESKIKYLVTIAYGQGRIDMRREIESKSCI